MGLIKYEILMRKKFKKPKHRLRNQILS